MQSGVKKRSVHFRARKTSVSLEDEFWQGQKEIAGARGQHTKQLITEIDANRLQPNLSSAIRIFVLDYFRTLTNDRAIGKSLGPVTIQEVRRPPTDL